MRPYGSKRTHGEWRHTCRRLKKITASKPLRIKSHKRGRQFDLSAELAALEKAVGSTPAVQGHREIG